MKFLLSLGLLLSFPSIAGTITSCVDDEYAAQRILEIAAKRDQTLELTNNKNEQVGAIFLSESGDPVDMILCGTYKNYFYVDLKMAEMIPQMYEFKQIATVESASIYQDEALMSAFAYTDDEMSVGENGQKIKINFQYVDLAEYHVESGEFYMVVEY